MDKTFELNNQYQKSYSQTFLMSSLVDFLVPVQHSALMHAVRIRKVHGTEGVATLS